MNPTYLRLVLHRLRAASFAVGAALCASGCARGGVAPRQSTAPTPAAHSESSGTKGLFPPHARRLEPPPGIESRAIPVGAEAPDFSLNDTHGRPFSLAAQLQHGAVVIVFYRGHW
jgi:hypothetical protein